MTDDQKKAGVPPDGARRPLSAPASGGDKVTPTDCDLCRELESELARLERIHAEKLGALRASRETARADEYRRLRAAESEARIDVDLAKRRLAIHKQHQQQAI
jgi:hypothetical protein